MALSWNEIKSRALAFSKDWESEERERAEKDTFYNEFFNVFGINRRRVAIFEKAVKKLSTHTGFIDLFWPGLLLVEHKSKGKDLDAAFEQAADYFEGLTEKELPRYILVSDFERFKLYDLEEKTEHEFALQDFHKEIKRFGFIAGYEKRTFKEQDPVNIKAAELMGQIHDQLENAGYKGHALEVYLVRLLFCLFADDTGIFERDTFKEYIELHTKEDGSDLGSMLNSFFEVLNTPESSRMSSMDEALAAFQYINGKLFEEPLPTAHFNSKLRQQLIECCSLDWGKISPAIFGSMFQSVMNPEERRNLGAHYTSEKNIMKVIGPLFLDELKAEFETIQNKKKALIDFHARLGKLKFLDPACGCGNFLIIAYRELRLLELEVLKKLYGQQQAISVGDIVQINVDQFYGIEYDEFPARIAEVAMWLMDHQMNLLVSMHYGINFVRLPLKASAKIVHANALRIDWETFIDESTYEVTADVTNIMVNEPPAHYGTLNVYSKAINVIHDDSPENKKPTKIKGEKVDYIMGNPPFYGKQLQTNEQKKDMEIIFSGVKGAGVLDYVTAWYIKAAEYIQDTKIRCAFVSTNSIAQGEQVSVLWNELFTKYKINIQYAHRTFKWTNEAKGKAAVYCVIIGFGVEDSNKKEIFNYSDVSGEPETIRVVNINPYLVEGTDQVIFSRSKPICNVPKVSYGSFALDDGYFTISEDEYNLIKIQSPSTLEFIRPFIGGRELLNSIKRYCIWLKDESPAKIKSDNIILEKVNNVRIWRAKSNRKTTKDLSNTPTVFAEIRQPETNYLAFPTLSSVRRNYIPIAYLDKNTISSNQLYIIANADKYEFGILTSAMHMAWIKSVCGRFKSDY